MRRLGELEAGVMVAVWKHDEPVTVRTILDELDRDPAPAYTTVITIVERLRAKGWLRRERVGRSFQYAAVRTAATYTAELMGDVLESSADRGAALQRFAGRLSVEEIADLRAALDERRRSGPE
ncbi:putative transcriptional regulator [Kribbella sp. VKM Ac-2527]|uniref:Putative transcriptional regulator n=2 Tax=Kribbella caucasensis TaxID=2512215 RepID=A0A4R6KF72_9ACTN|nr:putative transcriptional regulator [Kribbella sp. VKM Ac-2527]